MLTNEDEKNMLVQFEKLQEGSLDRHKDGSRFWIQYRTHCGDLYRVYRDRTCRNEGEFEGS